MGLQFFAERDARLGICGVAHHMEITDRRECAGQEFADHRVIVHDDHFNSITECFAGAHY